MSDERAKVAGVDELLWPVREVSKDPTNITKLDAEGNVLTSTTDVVAAVAAAGVGGGGTVTKVTVVGEDGVIGTVSNATTTPEIAISLGSITPADVSTNNVDATGSIRLTDLAGSDNRFYTVNSTGLWVGRNATTSQNYAFIETSVVDGSIKIASSSTSSVSLGRAGGSPVVVNGNSYPTNKGTSGQVLSTDGSGTLSWTTPAACVLKTGDTMTGKLELRVATTPFNPSGSVHVVGDRAAAVVAVDAYAANPAIRLWRSEGTAAAPTGAVSGNPLGAISFGGRLPDGSTTVSGQIRYFPDANAENGKPITGSFLIEASDAGGLVGVCRTSTSFFVSSLRDPRSASGTYNALNLNRTSCSMWSGGVASSFDTGVSANDDGQFLIRSPRGEFACTTVGNIYVVSKQGGTSKNVYFYTPANGNLSFQDCDHVTVGAVGALTHLFECNGTAIVRSTLDVTGNITSTGTAHSFVANSIPVSAVSGAVAKTGDTMTGVLNIRRDGTVGNAALQLIANSDSGNAPQVVLQKSKGTSAAPTPLAVNDVMGRIVCNSYKPDGSLTSGGFAGFYCAQAATANGVGSGFQVVTTGLRAGDGVSVNNSLTFDNTGNLTVDKVTAGTVRTNFIDGAGGGITTTGAFVVTGSTNGVFIGNFNSGSGVNIAAGGGNAAGECRCFAANLSGVARIAVGVEIANAGSATDFNGGVRIVTLPAGPNNYAIYSTPTAQSYHRGNLGLNVLAPTHQLEVGGDTMLRGPLEVTGNITSAGTAHSFAAASIPRSAVAGVDQTSLDGRYFRLTGGAVTGAMTVSQTAPLQYPLSITNGSSYAYFCGNNFNSAFFGPRPANDGNCTIQYSWDTVASNNSWQENYSAASFTIGQRLAGVYAVKLTIDTNGNLNSTGTAHTFAANSIPSTAVIGNVPRTIAATGSAGNSGQMVWDDNFIYLRTTSGWKKVALTAI